MGPAYFKGLSWNAITREERAFCAELFFQIRRDPDYFVHLLQTKANLPATVHGPWEVAFEACFYRDFLHMFAPEKKPMFSSKRTFDIALFSDTSIVIIEAKAAEPFTAAQAKDFQKDREAIQRLLAADVYLVALATERYFNNYRKIGRGTALAPFENRHLTWEAVSGHYKDSPPLLVRATEVYEKSPLAILEGDSLPHWQCGRDRDAQIKLLKEEIAQRQSAIEALEGDMPIGGEDNKGSRT